MKLVIGNDPVPLRMDETGTVRVGGTRVTIDVLLGLYDEGYSAEEIAYKLQPLRLPDVHAAIAYYHNHQGEIDAYLRDRRHEAEGLRQTWDQRRGQEGIRARLLARQEQKLPTP